MKLAMWSMVLVTCAASGVAAQEFAPCTNGDPNCTSFPGSVGIITTAPSSTLEVVGSGMISIPSGNTGSAVLSLKQQNVPSNQGFWILASRNVPNLGFYNFSLGADAMTLLPNGNVGIGNAAPIDRLTVNGNITVGTRRVIDLTGKWVGDPTGLKGDKGDKGDRGDQGIQGIQGQQGPPGPVINSVASCGAGSQGCSGTWATAESHPSPCQVTSDTGPCQLLNSQTGYCRVCVPPRP